MGQRNYNIDAEMIFADGAAAQTASGGGQVGGAAKIIDVGAKSRFEAVLVLDVSAIDTASGDEHYIFVLQGSNTADFSGAKENCAVLGLGHTSVRSGGALTSSPGRHEIVFTNEQDDVLYRYLRVFVVVSGTTPSVQYRAWASTKY